MTIKLNQILYLQQIGGEIGKEKIFKFKKVNIENITNGFVYVRLGLNTITEQISLAQWNYPDLNYIFNKLGEMCNKIYLILFFSVPLFKLHVKDELIYQSIKAANTIANSYSSYIKVKKPLFQDIFDMYGSYEKSFTESRFSLYMIQLVVILLLMLKRIYFGGFIKNSLLIVSFVLVILSLIDNIIYVILDFLTILFTLFSIVCFYKNKYQKISDDNIEIKLFLQFIINIVIFVFNIQLLIVSINLTSDVNKLRKAMERYIKKDDNIDEDNAQLRPVEFKYVSLDGNIISIREFRNDNLQRFLYYTSENPPIPNPENVQNEQNEILNINKNQVPQNPVNQNQNEQNNNVPEMFNRTNDVFFHNQEINPETNERLNN